MSTTKSKFVVWPEDENKSMTERPKQPAELRSKSEIENLFTELSVVTADICEEIDRLASVVKPVCFLTCPTEPKNETGQVDALTQLGQELVDLIRRAKLNLNKLKSLRNSVGL